MRNQGIIQLGVPIVSQYVERHSIDVIVLALLDARVARRWWMTTRRISLYCLPCRRPAGVRGG